MKLSDFPIQVPDDFLIKRSNQYGETLLLVTPQHAGPTWTSKNLIFRSSIWTEDGYLVSPCFQKFFNWNEKDNLIAPPSSLIGTTVVEKIDGSALIVSPFKGQTIIRTRGTFDVNIFENSYEITELRKRYPDAFTVEDRDETRIFEWYSPSNKIVLNMGPIPRLFLVGCIRHDDYSLLDQHALDRLATKIGVERPKTYKFNSIEDLLNQVQSFVGKEGICLYYDRDQHIKKIKAIQYLKIHAFKSDLSINNLLELYVEIGRPHYQQFYDHISNFYDFECAEIAKGDLSKLCDANKEVERLVEHMKGFVDKLRDKPRKEAAAEIFGSYGKTNRAGFAFTLLDGKELAKEAYVKLLHQILPK